MGTLVNRDFTLCDTYSSLGNNGSCCQKSYIGETVRNVKIRWQEHEDMQ